MRSTSVPRKTDNTAHPIVKFLFDEMRRQHCTYGQMEARTGHAYTKIGFWRYRTSPKLADVNDCLNVLGFELTIRRRRDPGDG